MFIKCVFHVCYRLHVSILPVFHAATFKSLVESPGALSVISSSQCTLSSVASWEGAGGHFHM